MQLWQGPGDLAGCPGPSVAIPVASGAFYEFVLSPQRSLQDPCINPLRKINPGRGFCAFSRKCT